MRLQDKAAIVTGAGIGEAIAHKFARDGARLVVSGLPSDPVHDEAIRNSGGRVEPHSGDLAEEFCTLEDLIVGSLDFPCCLPEGAHDIFSGNHTHQLTIGTYDREAAVPEANHQLQNACQRCRWFDMNNRFCHHVCHSSSHQLIEMGHNLTGCEGERPKEIQLGDYAEHFFCFHNGKSVEIMFLK